MKKYAITYFTFYAVRSPQMIFSILQKSMNCCRCLDYMFAINFLLVLCQLHDMPPQNFLSPWNNVVKAIQKPNYFYFITEYKKIEENCCKERSCFQYTVVKRRQQISFSVAAAVVADDDNNVALQIFFPILWYCMVYIHRVLYTDFYCFYHQNIFFTHHYHTMFHHRKKTFCFFFT